MYFQQQPIPMKICGEPLHHGPITGLSVCAWKTIFMTSGQIDKTVCVWDYTTESLLLSKHYHEQVYCVDLHPTGKESHGYLSFYCNRCAITDTRSAKF